ncbi:MAG: CheR family methyltransferase [Candidatus Saccharibacteria bacterium]
MTINVSEFFRNKNHWDVLQEKIIPEMLKDRQRIKIWSAGCSTGEEPYSLAIMMKENFYNRFEPIWATDIDLEVLQKAQMGLYNSKSVAATPPQLVKKYFHEEGNFIRIKDDIKSLVKFQRHDLLKDAFPTDFDLILCRNVVIYFTEETKDKLYRKFVGALRQNGVMFIGSTEQIFQGRELGLKSVATFFYQKI